MMGLLWFAQGLKTHSQSVSMNWGGAGWNSLPLMAQMHGGGLVLGDALRDAGVLAYRAARGNT
jgi:hypothetical protein